MNKKTGDWAPRKREDLIAMAKQWNTTLKEKGSKWGIAPSDFKELPALITAAEKALEKALSGDRTTTITAVCVEAFDNLLRYMRGIKNRKIFCPPLLDSDLISLGLKPRDTSRTPVETPNGFVTAEVSYPGPAHRLKLTMKPASSGEGDSRAAYGYRIYWGILPHGGGTLEQAAGPHRYLMKTPLDGGELPYSLFTRRRNENFDFDGEDAGKTVFFCIRYENSKGKTGPWGTIAQAVIP